MVRLGFLRQTVRLALLCAMTVACGSTRSGSGNGEPNRRPFPAPQWFQSSAKGDARFLYFIGSANGSVDEGTARELAVQKALYELSVYCGATLTTDFKSVEIEKNGKLNQQVALAVDVAGEEISIQEADTERWKVGRGSDGRYDAYVRIRWPRRQYQRVLAAQQARAERALALYLKAESATNAYRISDALRFVREARQALGPNRGQLPLRHPKYSNSGLVYDATEALAVRLQDMKKDLAGRMAVSVVCLENGAPKRCASRWVGTIRGRVTQAGFEVASRSVSTPTTNAILEAQNPAPDAALRSSGYVLAVKYDARLSGEDSGFVFARCGARGVLFGTDRKEILRITEVKPQKGGHVHFEGAVKKGCEQAEAKLVAWIDRHVGALKGNQR